jgi:site-specific recombinase XerD
MMYDSLLHRIKRIGANAGLGRMSPHTLRHCYAISLYAIAGDIRFVQDQLGHSSVTTTSIYARTKPSEGRRQVESLHIFGGIYPKRPDNVDKPDVLKKLGLQDV